MTKKKRRWLFIGGACLIALATICLFGYAAIEAAARPILFAKGEAEINNIVSDIMNLSIKHALAKAGDTSELLQVERDGSGKITMLSIDQGMVNQITLDSALEASGEMSKLKNQSFRIPMGNLLDSNLFSGTGPEFQITVLPAGSVSSKYYTEFESAGINQTRYKVYLVMEADVALIVGARSQDVTLKTEAVIADAIIVGAIPDTYADLAQGDGFLNLIP